MGHSEWERYLMFAFLTNVQHTMMRDTYKNPVRLQVAQKVK